MRDFAIWLFHAPRKIVQNYQAAVRATRPGQTDRDGHQSCRVCGDRFSGGDLCPDCELINNCT